MKWRVSLGFCSLVCFLMWLEPSICGWFLLASACHEAGHLLAMKALRVPVYQLSLTWSGAKIETGMMKNWVEGCCALAGPLTNAGLGWFFLRRLPAFSILHFFLAAVNLLPLYPLDGGRILLCLLRIWVRPDRAEKIVLAMNFVTCLVLMVGACWVSIALQAGLWPVFAALVLLWKAGNREKLLQFLRREDKMKKPEY